VLITQALEDYTACFAALCVLQAAVALPLVGVGDKAGGGPPAAAGPEGGRPPSALRAAAAAALRHARRACAALRPALRDLWQLLARSRWLPQVLACVLLSTFGFVGAASILVSFVQAWHTHGTMPRRMHRTCTPWAFRARCMHAVGGFTVHCAVHRVVHRAVHCVVPGLHRAPCTPPRSRTSIGGLGSG